MAVFNLSKIQIESNSQRPVWQTFRGSCCVQSFKDTNRKQFTTITMQHIFKHMLCSIFQRYKSKAIHNKHSEIKFFVSAVFNLSKIQIESNSQLCENPMYLHRCCVQSFKDTNRKQFTTTFIIVVIDDKLCSIFQRYKSKAIHNIIRLNLTTALAVFNLSKIQIESNSQRRTNLAAAVNCCVQSFKDTNRKQFTTVATLSGWWMTAVFNLSKIQIESNSQLFFLTYPNGWSCVQSFKDTNRKQFTTRFGQTSKKRTLCSIFQRYKSKAIHNVLNEQDFF